MNYQDKDIRKYQMRLRVSDLIIDVLTDKKTVQEALSLFPKDSNDINIKCAFDALMHREADEDFRKKVQGYAMVQDELLHDISSILKSNKNLPKNIIQKYLKFHKDDLIGSDKNDFSEFIKKIKRALYF